MMQTMASTRRGGNRFRLAGARQNATPLSDGGRFAYGGTAEYGLRTERMSVTIELPDMGADFRPIRYDSARRRTRSKRLEDRREQERQDKAAAFSRDGVRSSIALFLVLALAFVLVVIWVNDRADVNAAQGRVSVLNGRIREADRACERLNEEYETKAASVDVGYRAVDLGMISSKGVSMIELYVPEDVMMTPYAAAETAPTTASAAGIY